MVGALNTLSLPKKLLQHPIRISEFFLQKLRTITGLLVSTYEIKGKGVTSRATAELTIRPR
jgi:hypothetical protein